MARNSYTPVVAGVTKVMSTQINPVFLELASVAISSMYADYKTATTASANITLTDASEPIQSINCNGANRDVTLPALASTNHPFTIINRTASAYAITVKNASAVTLAVIPAGSVALFISDGANNWYGINGQSAGSGWTQAGWTNPLRTAATTFTVDQDITGIVQKGDKLKLTDTTTKYFSVTAVSAYTGGKTTLTITGGSDYTLVGDPSNIYYSKEENPQGFPDYFNWTPSWTNLSVGNGTYSAARFKVSGERVRYRVDFTWGTTTSASGNISLAVPVTSAATYTYVPAGIAALIDTSVYLYHGSVLLVSGSLSIRCMTQSGSYYGYAYVNATAPFTFASTDVITLEGEYPF